MTTKMMTKSTTTTMGYSIPLDLTFEILLRLPAKSVLRFRYVSKSWNSIIRSQQFIDAFMSLSLSRPRLVLAFERDEDRELFFYSRHQNSPFLSSSSVLEKDSLTLPNVKPFVNHIWDVNHICNSVRGFICCRQDNRFMVCNLTTRQVIPLAENNSDNLCYMYLGYSPNNDQYKVLRLMYPRFSDSHIEHSVCTLGGQQSSNSWRPIKANIPYNHSYQNGVCIDGVVYYEYYNGYKLVLSSFDVGSEQLRLIKTPGDLDLYLGGKLINYLGKLAVDDYNDNEVILWVLDDVKNQIWSKKTYILQSFSSSLLPSLHFIVITAFGEIVYAPLLFSDSCELLCYDMEKKMERRVRLEGLPKSHRFYLLHLCSYVENIVYL